MIIDYIYPRYFTIFLIGIFIANYKSDFTASKRENFSCICRVDYDSKTFAKYLLPIYTSLVQWRLKLFLVLKYINLLFHISLPFYCQPILDITSAWIFILKLNNLQPSLCQSTSGEVSFLQISKWKQPFFSTINLPAKLELRI